MPTVKFTARGVAAIKPTGKRIEYWDETLPGFGLRVTPNGVKSWCVYYRHGGRVRRHTLGAFPTLGLADAREQAREALRAVRLGGDPAAVKRQEKAAETFAELAALYLEKHASKKRSEYEDRRIVAAYLLPEWEHLKAGAITRRQVRDLVEGIAEGGPGRKAAPIMANRVLACIRKIYNWGIGHDLVEANPCLGVGRPGRETQRDRVLSDEEIQKVWAALEAETSPIADAFKLRLITAQRGGEVLGMTWAEVDLETHWWTIPAERSKNKLPHRVWLSDPAVRILKAARKREEANEERRAKRQRRDPQPVGHVFPGRRRGRSVAEAKRVLDAARTASGVADWTGHDLRRTAASHMTGMGISRLVVARILNHAEASVTAVYDRHSYDAEKKQALEQWARRLTVILSGLKAVDAK